MELFTYLMAKNDHNTSIKKDLFSYLLGKGQSGTYSSFSGTSISANNTKKGKMKLDLYGNTSQVSYTGKNLLNNLYYYSSGYETTNNGIKYHINSDGSITLSGTASALSSFNTFNTGFNDTTIIEPLDSSKNYTLSVSGVVSGVSVYVRAYDGSNLESKLTGSSITFTGKTGITAFYIQVNNGTAISTPITIYPQLEQASSPTSYEPYVGGTASPNPDYPQRVEVVSGDNTINVTGKNIITSFYASGSSYVSYDINNNLLQSTMTYSFIPNTTTTGVTIYIRSKNNNDYIYSKGTINITEGEKSTITFNLTDEQINNLKSVPSIMQIYKSSAGFNYNTLSNVQLEIGSTATDYTPYTSASYQVNLGSIELCKILNTSYQDGFFKAINGDSFYDSLDSATKETLEYGNWYLHKEIGKVVLDGTETWAENGNQTLTNTRYFYSTALDGLKVDQNNLSCYSNNFKDAILWGVDIEGINLVNGINGLRIRINKSLVTDTDTFKTWLSTHNTDVYYPLATPTYTQITDDTLISQLNAVHNAISYKGQTNISQVNDDLPFNLEAQIKVKV